MNLSPPLPTPGTSASIVDVDRWRQYLGTIDGRRALSRWRRADPALVGWTPDQLVSPIASASTDAMQAGLVGLAQGGDGPAAVALLVQLRPGLIRILRWAVAAGVCGPIDADDEVRASFFETLCRHPLDRRPTKIAANLLLDTRQRLDRAARRLRAVGATNVSSRVEVFGPGPVDPPGLAVPGAESMTDLVAIDLLRAAVEQLPGTEPSRQLTAELAYRAWVLDQSPTAIATELGLGRSTVASRLHRLRSLVRAAAA